MVDSSQDFGGSDLYDVQMNGDSRQAGQQVYIITILNIKYILYILYWHDCLLKLKHAFFLEEILIWKIRS